MKKIIFPIVGSMLISLCAVQAQQQYDTTGTARSRNKQQNQQRYEQSQEQRDQYRQQRGQSWQQQNDQSKNQDAYANEGMVIIDKKEIPSSLKKTLKEDKYSGWENATIYHNTNTGEYVIAPRAYRFDKQGNEIEMGNLGYSSADGQRCYSQDQSSQRTYDQSQRSDQNRSYDQSRNQTYDPSTGQDRNRRYDQSPNRSGQTRYDQPGQNDQSSQNRAYDQSSQNRSYDQSNDQRSGNTYDQSSQNRTYDQSTENRQSDDQSTTGERSYDQSSSAQDQSTQSTSDAYRSGQQDQQSSTDRNQQSGTSSSAYSSGQTGQTQYETEGMVEIETDQIPASLRRTLSDRQYSGWEERGTLYQDPSTNEYILVMEGDDSSRSSTSSQYNGQNRSSQSQSQGYNSTGESQTYRFDKNGQLKEDQSGTSQRNNGQ